MLADYVRPIPGADLAAAGVTGVLRYIAKEGGSSVVVGVTAAELADLDAHNIGWALIYEAQAADWMAGGYSTGVQAGQWIQQQIAGLGRAVRTVYLAADSPTLSSAAVCACLDGAASVLGREIIGLYGFSAQLAAAQSGGHASRYWLCGHYAPASWMCLYQCNGSQPSGPSTLTVAGQSCDVDIALSQDWGQTGVNTMEWTDQIPFPTTANPTATAQAQLCIANADLYAGQAVTNTQAILAQLAALTATVGQLAQHPEATPDQIKAWIDDAVAQHIQITGQVQIGPVPAPAPTGTTPA